MNLRERLAQLDDRERRLLGLLVVVFVGVVVLLVPAGTAAVLASQRGGNEALQEAITAIQDNRALIQRRETEKQALDRRYERQAPPLASFLANLASQTSVEIPETQDRANVPHGSRYEERSTRIVLRKVSMLPLAKFMERIIQSEYPVSITRLNIRKRGTEPDSYDVQMIVSAFDRKAKPEPTEAEPAATAGEEEGVLP
jgi:general secretion pathway protein M